MKRFSKNLFVIILILISLIASGTGVLPAYAAGSSVEVVPLPLPAGVSSGYLYGVWGSGTSDVYAVGSSYNGSTIMPLLYHKDGSGWSASSLSLPAGVGSGYLYGIWGSSASDVYSVGSGNNGSAIVPLLYHKDGSGWSASSLSLPTGWSSGNFKGIWGSSASDVYAVGSGNNGSTIVPLLYHNDGSGWSASSLSLPAGVSSGDLYGVWGSSASDVYAVGSGNNGNVPLLYHNDGSGWSASSLPPCQPGGVLAILRVYGVLAPTMYML